MDVLATVKKVDTKIESCSQKEVELSCKVIITVIRAVAQIVLIRNVFSGTL